MKKLFPISIIALTSIFANRVIAQNTPHNTEAHNIVEMPSMDIEIIGSAALKDANGKQLGYASIYKKDGALHIDAQAEDLSAGDHGIHIHSIGKCEAPDFQTAGGHLNTNNKQHGLQNPLGSHAGDLPQLKIYENGKGIIDYKINTILEDLFDANGSSIVIHANADDEKTDPSGNSGARILCGVLEKKS